MKTPMRLLCALVGCLSLATLPGCTTPAAKEAVRFPAMPLVDTHWRLAQLGDEVIDNPPGERDVHIVLQSKDPTVTGNAGCNSMFGAYALNGDSIRFDQMGGTRMFCQGRMNLEQKFLAIFATITRWKIVGQTLQLFDSSGAVVATFEAAMATG